MRAVADLDLEQDGGVVALRGIDVDVADIALLARDTRRGFGEQAHAVRGLDDESGNEDVRLLVFLPDRGNPLVVLLAEGGDVRAVFAMDREAAARVADDKALRPGDRKRLRDRSIRAQVIVRQEPARNEARESLAEADPLEQFLAVSQRQRARDLVEPARRKLLQR